MNPLAFIFWGAVACFGYAYGGMAGVGLVLVLCLFAQVVIE